MFNFISPNYQQLIITKKKKNSKKHSFNQIPFSNISNINILRLGTKTDITTDNRHKTSSISKQTSRPLLYYILCNIRAKLFGQRKIPRFNRETNTITTSLTNRLKIAQSQKPLKRRPAWKVETRLRFPSLGRSVWEAYLGRLPTVVS